MKKLILFFGILAFGMPFCQLTVGQTTRQATLINFVDNRQITRFDGLAAAVDAHDGEIALFDGVYYLYGTSYDCGFEWQNTNAPFCGFKVYTSSDLVHWTDKGFLFDTQTEIWQERCNGGTYGCFRPHVVYNKKNNNYVLWINVYDNRVGFRVFTSSCPAGPFTEVAEPTLAVNSDAPVAGLNNGDHDLFVDDDDVAYIAYTDWRTGGTIVIDKLNEDYTSGTGKHVKDVTSGRTEAPGMMKRNGIYYILYSDPNCGYCGGTGTSYKSAAAPLGPWTEGTKISSNSCGGQPSFVSVFKLESDTIFLYGSDLWNNGARNESLANFYWAPLRFNANGSIAPLECQGAITLPIEETPFEPETPIDLDCSSGNDGFSTFSDITDACSRGQTFVATCTGTLTAVSFATHRSGYPEAGLTIEIYKTGSNYLPIGNALSSIVVPTDAIGWAPKFVTVQPNIQVKAGTSYAIVVKTTKGGGSYGMQYNDRFPYKQGRALYRLNTQNFNVEANRTLMFQTFIHAGTRAKH
ncbi:MAG: family 43 glycosylhydrolase [Dysgonamonadaceae bacterium]|jgi:hypothetical protein|nr:family 43 glycosylhydrolase [Dysgonamonadaceae bacterium]